MQNFTETFSQTPLTFIILGITLYTTYIFFKLNSDKQRDLLLRPYAIYRGENFKSMITSIMIHSNWQHFLFNMISFYFFAPIIEQSIGMTKFFWLYLLSGVFGSLPLVIKYKNNAYYSALGASGAVSGVVFAFITLYPTAQLGFFLIPFSLPAFVFGIIYLAGSYYMSQRSSDNVAHEAHIGGAVFGVIFMVLFR